MSLLSKAWSPPPVPVRGPVPVTVAHLAMMTAQTFNAITTPQPLPFAYKKTIVSANTPRFFAPVTLHNVAVHFGPDALDTLRTACAAVQAQIHRVLSLKQMSLKGVPVKDITYALSRSSRHELRGHVRGIGQIDDDPQSFDFKRAYKIHTYRPPDMLGTSTVFETLIWKRKEKTFANGLTKVVSTLVDPARPCALPGTTEFGELARAATYRLSGQSCSTPCYTCSCAGKVDFALS